MFHICFAADENYIKYTAVLITSIVKSTDTERKFVDFFVNSNSTQISSLSNYKKLNFHTLSEDEKREGYIFHILSDFVSENSREKLANLAKKLSEIYPCEIKIHIYSEGEKFKEIATFAGHLTFYRLLISDFLPEIKRALYLDVDMLVCGDLRELFTLDLSGKIAAAVPDIKSSREKSNENLPSKLDFYFNAGLLLLNLEAFNAHKIKQKCFDFLFKFKPFFADQDALNRTISQDFVCILPPEFNLFVAQAFNQKWQDEFSCSLQELKNVREKPVILHFSGDGKAWNFGFCVDESSMRAGFKWWRVAFDTPFFGDELAFKSFCVMSPIYAKFKDKFAFDALFEKYLATLMWQLSQSIFGYIKMPFLVRKIFKLRKRKKLSIKTMQNFLNSSENLLEILNFNEKELALKFAQITKRAWDRRAEFKLFFLPFKIYRTKSKFLRH